MYEYVLWINVMSKSQGVIKDFIVCGENVTPLHPPSVFNSVYFQAHFQLHIIHSSREMLFFMYLHLLFTIIPTSNMFQIRQKDYLARYNEWVHSFKKESIRKAWAYHHQQKPGQKDE